MRTGKDKDPHGWSDRNQLQTICYRRKRSGHVPDWQMNRGDLWKEQTTSREKIQRQRGERKVTNGGESRACVLL